MTMGLLASESEQHRGAWLPQSAEDMTLDLGVVSTRADDVCAETGQWWKEMG